MYMKRNIKNAAENEMNQASTTYPAPAINKRQILLPFNCIDDCMTFAIFFLNINSIGKKLIFSFGNEISTKCFMML